MGTLNSTAIVSSFRKIQLDGTFNVEFYDSEGVLVKISSNEPTHPDLQKSFAALIPYVTLIADFNTEIGVIPKTVQFNGKGQAIFSGVRLPGNNYRVEWKTSPISRGVMQIQGFERDVFDVIEDIEKETRQYLFEGKTAQLTIPGFKSNN